MGKIAKIKFSKKVNSCLFINDIDNGLTINRFLE